jgi:hypothetical protein
VKRLARIVGAIGLPLLVAACGAAPDEAVKASSAASDAPPTVPPSSESLPCDPGTGFPVPKDGCPDAEPETGWLKASDDGLVLTVFESLGNDAEGKAYAREHGEEYPYSNDYFDAPSGAKYPITLAEGTVCSGAILIRFADIDADADGWDHAVACSELVKVAAQRRVPVAIWRSGGKVVQASELYRP